MGISIYLLHTKYLFVDIDKNALVQEKKCQFSQSNLVLIRSWQFVLRKTVGWSQQGTDMHKQQLAWFMISLPLNLLKCTFVQLSVQEHRYKESYQEMQFYLVINIDRNTMYFLAYDSTVFVSTPSQIHLLPQFIFFQPPQTAF